MAEYKYLDLTGLQHYDEKLKALVEAKDAAALAEAKKYAEDLGVNYDPAGTAATKVQELADGQVKTNTDAIGSLEDLETTAKSDLVEALNEVRNSVSAGGVSAAVTIDTSTTTDGALKSYTIKQGSNVVGTIDIPKDMVVESGSVVSLAENEIEGYAAGTYIKLVLANVTDPLYINVGTLVDIYTAKANATQVQLTIDSSTREISAVIVAESITSAELAANAITTVKIADGNVTKAKLSTEVQASLDKADVAEQNAKDYADELNEAMDARVKDVENALADGGSIDTKIAAAKSEAISTAASDATAKADAALADAKEYADEKAAVNAADIDKLEESLAEGGATALAIADAKQAGIDAQDAVAALEESLVEITTDEIDALFASE